jgi:two-component system cell cycle sensor histidine kinase/response regulator CckA
VTDSTEMVVNLIDVLTNSTDKVLIVNDVPDQLQLMTIMMERAGYTVSNARDGVEAFEIAWQLKPILIISDVCMPGVDGIELTRRIRSSAKLSDTPVLLISSLRGTDPDAIEGLKAGADDYVEAHIDPMRLIAKVARLVERGRAEEALKSSEQEKAEALQALRKSEAQLLLAQKLEAVGRLAGGIAHDFNNLLTVIKGYSQLALRRLHEDDSLRSQIEQIVKASERAAALVSQLLAFSRKQVMQPRVLDLNDIVADLESMFRRLIGEDIELRASLQADLAAVRADPSQIEQVIMNLVINARDAMPAGGKLTIETANTYLDETYAEQHFSVTAGDYVMLAVSDTGVGMDEETRQHIFEPFFTTKDTGRGTGLGLSTVYGIVKQSGGNIWVYSEVGGGTTFKIYLPRVNEGVEVAKQVALNQELPLATETILLVEDDQALRELVQEVLELAGYQVLEAATGEAAISICEHREKTIHLLVTDVVMPEIGGPELAERLLALHPEMRTLYISGYADDAIVHHGVLAEGTNFLAKPFSPRALELKVREVLKAADED